MSPILEAQRNAYSKFYQNELVLWAADRQLRNVNNKTFNCTLLRNIIFFIAVYKTNVILISASIYIHLAGEGDSSSFLTAKRLNVCPLKPKECRGDSKVFSLRSISYLFPKQAVLYPY